MQYLTLAHTPALHTLRLSVSPTNGAAICSALITSVLPTLCAPELHTLLLLFDCTARVLHAPHGFALQAVPWADLDAQVVLLLGVARLQVLHELYAEDEAVVRAALPRCEARGILFFKPE